MIFTDPQAIQQVRAALYAERKRLVLTNGVFDLLHVGHLRYLQAAAALGDALWVAVNSDASVRHLKGASRPIVPWAERAELLAALAPVTAVLFFDEDTADSVLRLVRPDIYVKGGDYSAATLPEATTAQAVGAELAFLPFVAGRSTTALLDQLLQEPSITMPPSSSAPL